MLKGIDAFHIPSPMQVIYNYIWLRSAMLSTRWVLSSKKITRWVLIIRYQALPLNHNSDKRSIILSATNRSPNKSLANSIGLTRAGVQCKYMTCVILVQNLLTNKIVYMTQTQPWNCCHRISIFAKKMSEKYARSKHAIYISKLIFW